MQTEDRYERMKKALEDYSKKVTSPEAARKALVRAGIYTKAGNLTKHYAPAEADKR
jgi:hypothetical protein